jgi:hypothetical protein
LKKYFAMAVSTKNAKRNIELLGGCTVNKYNFHSTNVTSSVMYQCLVGKKHAFTRNVSVI